MKKIIFLLVGLFTTQVWGQSPETNARVQTREVQKGSMVSQDDMGWPEEEEEEFGALLKLKKAKAWFIQPTASVQGYWTSNVLLASRGEKGDSVFSENQGLQAGYRLSSDLSLSANYNYQITRYSENPLLDVDSHSTGCSIQYKLPWNFELQVGMNGLWLSSPDQKVEVYRENNPYVTISQSHFWFDQRFSWYYGYQFDQKWANPVTYERDEHSFFTGVSYLWLSNLMSQLGLRQNYQFYHFRDEQQLVNGRQEWVSSVVLQTVWQPLSFMQVSGYGMMVYDNSVNSANDYKLANAGGELRFFWKF